MDALENFFFSFLNQSSFISYYNIQEKETHIRNSKLIDFNSLINYISFDQKRNKTKMFKQIKSSN